MDDLFKKFINTGVGFLSQGNKAVQVAIEKLVKESKISEQEGKKIVDDLLKNSETKRADLEKQFKGLTADLKSRVGLKAEEKPAAKPKAAPKAAASSATAKKPATKKPAASSEATGTVKKAAAKAGAPKKAPTLSADDSGESLNAS